jgi:hypothetical protein
MSQDTPIMAKTTTFDDDHANIGSQIETNATETRLGESVQMIGQV